MAPGRPPADPCHRHPLGLQGAIYRLEHGGGAKFVRAALALLAMAGLAAYYDAHFYKDFQSEEAMDSAQLAENLAEGRGFTTMYVRPLSVALLASRGLEPESGRPHPDLANAPVLSLGGGGPDENPPAPYGHSPGPATELHHLSARTLDLLLQSDALSCRRDRALFHGPEALFDEAQITPGFPPWHSPGSEVYWRFSISGLPTLLRVLVFLGAAWLVVLWDAEIRTESPRLARVVRLACGFGSPDGGWRPDALRLRMAHGSNRCFFSSFLGENCAATVGHRRRHGLPSPDGSLAGSETTPFPDDLFGLAGYAPAELTAPFPRDTLVRSANLAALQQQSAGLWDYSRKMTGNLHDLLRGAGSSPLAGTGFSCFFCRRIPAPFPCNKRGPRAGCAIFLLLLLAVFIPVEGLAQTHLSVDSPVVNSENLLVVFAPVAFIFGAGFFCTLVEQGLGFTPFLRPAFAGFALLTTLPFLTGLMAPSSHPVSYPPYYRRRSAHNSPPWLKPEEAVMTDIPGSTPSPGYGASAARSLSP